MIDLSSQRYAFLALAAAALFGASTPLAKLLLDDVSPAMLAGLLYLGSGLGLFIASLVRHAWRSTQSGDGTAAPGVPADQALFAGSQARPAQYAWLGAAILFGGVAAPLALMWGLARTSAAGASLLLNAESVLTTLLAAAFFAERVGGRVWLATAVMLAAGIALASGEGGFDWSGTSSAGALAVVAACFFWALDNNCTRRVAHGNALQIAMLKGLVAGAVNLAIAFALGTTQTMGPADGAASLWPAFNAALMALVLGAFAYGASLVLYVRALRHLGSARTGAHFATAPFVGAAVALALGESPGAAFWAALVLMFIAVWLLLTERHMHRHSHARMEHAHEHVHDAHHRHWHEPGEGAQNDQPHTHQHVHEALTHLHPHVPDLHHTHRH